MAQIEELLEIEGNEATLEQLVQITQVVSTHQDRGAIPNTEVDLSGYRRAI